MSHLIRSLQLVSSAALACCLAGCAPSMQAPAAEPSPNLTYASGATRKDLRFSCGDATCAGWLYLPAPSLRSEDRPPPIVVMGNGFSGTRDVGMPVFAATFADNGIAAFAFDYRFFGASGGSPRQLINPWAQLDDWRSALAFVRTLNEVDPVRLALWGTSMAGGLVLIIGAEDPGVRAIVAQVPAVDADAEAEGPEVSLIWGVRLLLTAWADLVQSSWSDEAVLMPAFAPHGEFGMIVDDQSYRDIRPLIPEKTDYQNAIAARSFTTFDDYNPVSAWASINVPTLVLATRADRLAPFSAVVAFAAANPNVAVESFKGGHFDIYQQPLAAWATEREVQFLTAALSTR